MKLIECVPNFSEGRRPEVVAAIRDAIAAVPGVAMLDVSSDPSHNRTVITFVAPAERAVPRGVRRHRHGARPDRPHRAHRRASAHRRDRRLPVHPARGRDDGRLRRARPRARRAGRRASSASRSSSTSARPPGPIATNLADIRRGEFEKARDEIGTNPDRVPDFGPNTIHPTAGATVIGARPFLVAYNVYLGPASNLAVAKEVAKAVRASGGGLPAVKALGLEVDGQAQVSMNLVDTDTTPIWRAYDAVKTRGRDSAA